MNWIPKILIAIAASNTFGAINYYLKNTGILIDHYRIIKLFVLFSAYWVAILAYRRNSIAVVFSYFFLVLGVISALLAIYTGIQVGANKTLVLAIIWLFSFGYAIYLFYKHNSEIESDNA
jgi:hypothetical protein